MVFDHTAREHRAQPNARVIEPATPQIQPGRGAWQAERLRLESARRANNLRARRKRLPEWILRHGLRGFCRVLKVSRLEARGRANALDVRLRQVEFVFDDLPVAFDGFRILHLSDIHVDVLPEAATRAAALAAGVEADVCVMTGDYMHHTHTGLNHIRDGMRALAASVNAKHGLYGVLGNHDAASVTPVLESAGLRMLINESTTIDVDGTRLCLTGTDDPHYFQTPANEAALASAPDGFKIALIHTAEIADRAAAHGFRLYLAGHTHGGQVCLPGGRPILTRLHRYRRYAMGKWRHGEMQGYTTAGVGASPPAVRFNSRGEVALITLRRAGQPS